MLGMMADEKKKDATLVIEPIKQDSSEPADIIAKGIFDAVKADDFEKFKKGLKAFVKICSYEMED